MSKVIAVIEKPKDCEKCVFGICKYSLPLSTNRKGYYCQLKEPIQRVVEDFACNDVVHLNNCPLKPLPKKQQVRFSGGQEMMALGWNACIEEIEKK